MLALNGGETPMFDKFEILQLSGDMARHASARQTLVARNIANANTPGYEPMDIGSFQSQKRRLDFASSLRTTRAGHIGASETQNFVGQEIKASSAKPNGNAVSLEAEMVKGASIRQDHQMALSVYSKAIEILRLSAGRR